MTFRLHKSGDMDMFGNKFYFFNIIVFMLVSLVIASSSENLESDELSDKTTFTDPAERLFTKLFMKRRREQLDAVKNLLAIDSYEKQHKMVALMTDKIFNIIEKCRVELENSGYDPVNSSFPSEQQVLDALANTLENTALFGDMLLRLPDVTHRILKLNPDWGELIKWSISFVNATNLLDKQSTRLMYLMSQELKIVERDSDYVNPYRKQEQQPTPALISTAKKKKKQRKKGPQLSSGHLTGEL